MNFDFNSAFLSFNFGIDGLALFMLLTIVGGLIALRVCTQYYLNKPPEKQFTYK